jgi:hypothetical protein
MKTRKTAFATPESTQSSDSSPGVAIDSPNEEMRPLDAPEAVNRNESSDSYGDVVAVLNRSWRVIRCRDGIQWILQSRDSATAAKGVWRGRSYCRTKEALLRVCAAHAGKIDPTAVGLLVELPDWTEAPGMSDRMNDAASSASGEASMSLRPAGCQQRAAYVDHAKGSMTIKAHPTANLFEMLKGDELRELAADIKAKGLQTPIVMYEGMILDERNRYAACELAKVKPRFETYSGDDPVGYVISANVARRHLDESQRGLAAARLAQMPKGGDRRSKDFKGSNEPLIYTIDEAAMLLNVSHCHEAQSGGCEMSRELLPNRRTRTTFGFDCSGQTYTATTSCFPGCERLVEIFNNARSDSGVMASGSGVAFANTGPGKDPASDMVTASAADQSRYGGDSSWR